MAENEAKKLATTEVVEELSEEEFTKLPESDSGGKIDYEKVWGLVKGRIVTSAGLDVAVNKVRKEAGFEPREFYFSERKRVFGVWTRKGRKIEKRLAPIGKKRMAVFKFME